jgi:SAM-dependent methyltransferase
MTPATRILSVSDNGVPQLKTRMFHTAVVREIENVARRIRLRAYGSRRLDGALCALHTSADSTRIAQLSRALAADYRQDSFSAAKYVDFPIWSLRNIHRAAQLGLHHTSGLRILDIGAGPGYFIAAARALGHDCRGIDVPDSCFTPLERQVYTGLLQALNCRQYVSPFSVERFVPLPFDGEPYDLITAFLVCFNRHNKPDQWGVPEWRFFVEDALGKLRAGGRLFLGLNDNRKRFGKLLFYDDALLAYFRSVGAVEGSRITIVNTLPAVSGSSAAGKWSSISA